MSVRGGWRRREQSRVWTGTRGGGGHAFVLEEGWGSEGKGCKGHRWRPSLPRAVSEIQFPLVSHDCWVKDLRFWTHGKFWSVAPSPGPAVVQLGSMFVPALPFAAPRPHLPALLLLLSKATASLYSLSTCCFSAAMSPRGYIFSELVLELKERILRTQLAPLCRGEK